MIRFISMTTLFIRSAWHFLGGKLTKWPMWSNGLGVPTNRDQQSWTFLKDPRKYFATDRKPTNIFSEKENPVETLS